MTVHGGEGGGRSAGDTPVAAAPPRLVDDAADAGALLRAAGRAYARGLDEPAGWARFAAATLAITPGRARARRIARLAIPLALAAAVALVLAGRLSPRRAPAPSPSLAEHAAPVPAPAPGPAPAPAPAEAQAAPRPLIPSPRPRALPAGATLLADGTRVQLAPRAQAAVSAQRALTTIALASGAIEIDRAPAAAAPHIQIESGRYRFQVAGARFRLVSAEARADLEVRDGTVTVMVGGRLIARVRPGQRWTGPLVASSDARAISAARAEAVAPPADGLAATPAPAPAREAGASDDCLAMARVGRTRQALDCFGHIAQGSGLSAEVALYEIARLRRDVLGDAAGAAAALEQYRARFPAGELRTEVEVSLLELLPKLGRPREALAESERLLATAAGRERAPELRFLRGSIYCDILKDYAAAEAEYAAAARYRGVTADEAAFQRGLCFEALGRPTEAGTAFRAYLERPQPRRAGEARRHLDALGR